MRPWRWSLDNHGWIISRKSESGLGEEMRDLEGAMECRGDAIDCVFESVEGGVRLDGECLPLACAVPFECIEPFATPVLFAWPFAIG